MHPQGRQGPCSRVQKYLDQATGYGGIGSSLKVLKVLALRRALASGQTGQTGRTLEDPRQTAGWARDGYG